MSEQIRLYFNTDKQKSEEIYHKAEVAFEDDGWPIAVFDEEDNGVFEISLYVDKSEEQDGKQRLAEISGIEETEISVEVLPEIDWVKHSLEGLDPVRAGQFFVHGAHDRDKIRPNEISIEIEANRAFGTGHHDTTAGCLEMLEKIIKKENINTILDVGTGSGILAIAAAKLGKSQILATDNDPIAIEIANENIALNNTINAITTAVAEGFASDEIKQKEPFDLIIANILAGPLMLMAEDMKKAAKSGGALLLSGILDSQHDAVVATYEKQAFKHIETLHKQDWVSIYLRA